MSINTSGNNTSGNNTSGNNTSGKITSAIERADSADFRTIIRNKIPLMDVRAPVEFEKGAFNQSINYPLMNNDEREKVGVCYKNNGQEAAITLGNALVSGQVKQVD